PCVSGETPTVKSSTDESRNSTGLVNDGAVSSKVLTESEIDAILNTAGKQINDSRAGLQTAWVFGSSTRSAGQLPASLKRAVTFRSLPYANRYQWNSAPAQPLEARLISNPSAILASGDAVGRLNDVIKFGKTRMILGGTTTTHSGGSEAAYDSLMSR